MGYSSVVLGAGRTPCPVMFIGEAPGEVESRTGEPFVGPSGLEQDRYLSLYRYQCRMFYRTNLSKSYIPGNPDPTPSQIAAWRDTLRYEISIVRPALIVTVGAYATWEFLRTSDALSPEPYFLTGKVHGVPHLVSDKSPHADLLGDVFSGSYVTPCGSGSNTYPCIILPIIHPAAGKRTTEDALALRSSIFWDYSQVARCIDLVLSSKPIDVPHDEYTSDLHPVDYRVISPLELPLVLPYDVAEFSLDTEGTPDNPFSVQVSCAPGTGYMLLIDDPLYATVAAPYIQAILNRGAIVYTHSRYEIEMSSAIHLDFSYANLLDTMYAPYLLLTEPQGLKALAHRHCGMLMTDHNDTIKPLGDIRQIDYLEEVVRRSQLLTIDLTGIGVKVPTACKPKIKLPPVSKLRLRAAEEITALLHGTYLHPIIAPATAPKSVVISQWPIPAKRPVVENDGTVHEYKPSHIGKYAAGILAAHYAGLDSIEIDDESGEPLSIEKRWKSIGRKHRLFRELRGPVELALGKLPHGSVRALYESSNPSDRKRAVYYSCRDPDGTGRFARAVRPKLANFHGHDLTQLWYDGSCLSTVWDEMQARGVPVHIPSLRQLSTELESSMRGIGAMISYQFWGGEPFNPNSPPQVEELLRRRGLTGLERNQSGGYSTSKRSIEGLRYTDPAFKLVFDWREHEHTLSSFIWPTLDDIPDDYTGEYWRLRGRIKNTRTTSRRVAAEAPNVLAFPKHSKYGKALRACCMAPEGYLLIAPDYSQIEVRGMANASGDRLMCEIFNRDAQHYTKLERDFHIQTAALLFNVRPEDVDDDTQRTPSKRITFGVGYGLRGHGLAAQLQSFGITGWPEDRCEEFIREWYKLYSGFAEYTKRCTEEARRTGIAFDDWGMPRYVSGIWSRTPKIVAESARHYVSHKIQGWAQGAIQNAMRALKPIMLQWQRVDGYKIYWLLQEHDALVFECEERIVDIVKPVTVNAMTRSHGVKNCRVPIEVDVKVTRAWGSKS